MDALVIPVGWLPGVWSVLIRTVFISRDLARRIAGLSRLIEVEADELKRRIQRAAEAHGMAWRLLWQGGRHEVWQCGSTQVTIPRHREVNELTAGAIFKALEPELGRAWWRR